MSNTLYAECSHCADVVTIDGRQVGDSATCEQGHTLLVERQRDGQYGSWIEVLAYDGGGGVYCAWAEEREKLATYYDEAASERLLD